MVTLMFGVGRVHEDARMSGVSHLVEHLTLFPLGRRTYDYNGSVGAATTVFYASGTIQECASFLSDVQRSLTSLALERTEVERGVLQAESDGRGAGLVEQLIAFRYGARGPGVLAMDELGLRWLTARAVESRRALTMHRGSAAIIAAGVPLELIDIALPPAAPEATFPVVDVRVVEQGLPAWFCHGGDRHVAWSATRGRSSAASAATRVLVRRLHDRLRLELGLAYGVASDEIRLGRALRHTTLLCDSSAQHSAAARDEIQRALDELATNGPSEAELVEDAERLRRMWIEPEARIGIAHALAEEMLTGGGTSADSLQAELRELTADGIRDAAAELAADGLWALPLGVDGPAAARKVAASAPRAVEGRRHGRAKTAATPEPPSESLTVGLDGLTWTAPDGTFSTVRFDDVAVALRWGNGARVLIGGDGFRVAVAPWDWQLGDAVRSAVDERVPPDRWVDMGEGDPAPAPHRPHRSGWRRLAWAAYFVVLVPLAGIAAILAGAAPAPFASDAPGVPADFIDADGFVRCGGPPSVRIALFGAEAASDGAPPPVKQACETEAASATSGAAMLLVFAAGPAIAFGVVRRRTARGARL